MTQITSIDQVIPLLTKHVSESFEGQEESEITAIVNIFRKFMVDTGIWATVENGLKTPAPIRINTSGAVVGGSVPAPADKKPRKPRAAKDVDKLTEYDCYNKLVGVDWKALSKDEQKTFVDQNRLDKNGKPISAFINFKGQWKGYTPEQKAQYKTRFYELPEETRAQMTAKKE